MPPVPRKGRYAYTGEGGQGEGEEVRARSLSSEPSGASHFLAWPDRNHAGAHPPLNYASVYFNFSMLQTLG